MPAEMPERWKGFGSINAIACGKEKGPGEPGPIFFE